MKKMMCSKRNVWAIMEPAGKLKSGEQVYECAACGGYHTVAECERAFERMAKNK